MGSPESGLTAANTSDGTGCNLAMTPCKRTGEAVLGENAGAGTVRRERQTRRCGSTMRRKNESPSDRMGFRHITRGDQKFLMISTISAPMRF